MLFDQWSPGRYVVGNRLPSERELSLEPGASRPAVRDALTASEVQSHIAARVGSGASVRKLSGDEERPGFAITAF